MVIKIYNQTHPKAGEVCTKHLVDRFGHLTKFKGTEEELIELFEEMLAQYDPIKDDSQKSHFKYTCAKNALEFLG